MGRSVSEKKIGVGPAADPGDSLGGGMGHAFGDEAALDDASSGDGLRGGDPLHDGPSDLRTAGTPDLPDVKPVGVGILMALDDEVGEAPEEERAQGQRLLGGRPRLVKLPVQVEAVAVEAGVVDIAEGILAGQDRQVEGGGAGKIRFEEAEDCLHAGRLIAVDARGDAEMRRALSGRHAEGQQGIAVGGILQTGDLGEDPGGVSFGHCPDAIEQGGVGADPWKWRHGIEDI